MAGGMSDGGDFVVVGQVQIWFLSGWRMRLLIERLRPAAPQDPRQVQ